MNRLHGVHDRHQQQLAAGFEHDVGLAHGLQARRRPVDPADNPLEYSFGHARRV